MSINYLINQGCFVISNIKNDFLKRNLKVLHINRWREDNIDDFACALGINIPTGKDDGNKKSTCNATRI